MRIQIMCILGEIKSTSRQHIHVCIKLVNSRTPFHFNISNYVMLHLNQQHTQYNKRDLEIDVWPSHCKQLVVSGYPSAHIWDLRFGVGS